MNDRPTLYLLDAYSIIYQVFHAIPTMTGPAGQPTNAVFGIMRDVLNLHRDRKPHSVAAAFDGPGRVFRSDLFEEYKANRSAMPDDLQPQIPLIRRVFEGFRIPILEYEGAEADDVIATIARLGVDQGMDVFICTSDKDARQLLGEHVFIYNLRKQQVLDAEGLQKDWGVGPDQVVDLLSLTGDAVDNVPGVPGIGTKTAAQLLQQFGSLDALLENIPKVSGVKRKENLYKHADVARKARELIALRTDLPIPFDWADLRRDEIDHGALKALCIECGFHRFLDEIAASEPDRPEDIWPVEEYQVIDTPEKFDRFLSALREQRRFSFDTETTALDPLQAELVGLSFCWNAGEAFYLPVRGPEGSRTLDQAATLEALAPILSDPAREVVGQNLKYDYLVLGKLGVALSESISDTMVLSYLLESGERNHNLDELARRLLDHSMIPIASLIGKGKLQTTIDTVAIDRVAAYAGEDADAAWRLDAILAPKVREEGLGDLYETVERPLIAVLARMEATGIAVDVEKLRQLSTEFADRLETIRGEIYEIAGREFNIGSAQQLRQILFEDLKLKPTKKTPGGEPSTDAEVLEALSAEHPLPRLIVQHRQLDKLKGTYLDALPELVHPDGRIHASFNQVVTATGRLSSSDPNLQNIPVRTEDGRQIRQAFVAKGPGWSLLTADYSQIELRILAHFSKDPELVRAFAENRDIHRVVAAQIFGVPEGEVTKDQRRMAKTVNFGVIYGLSPFGLATRLGISQGDAALFIDAYFRQYEGVDRFITETLEQAVVAGRVETILGRRRAISGIKNTTGRNRNLAERTAVNTVIQGSAADLIKRAMLDVDRRLRDDRREARMLLQIHDELVFEAPTEELPGLARMVAEAMAAALPLDVPLQVDLAAGPNWLDVTPLTPAG
ncbi:DNA polymerase I [Tautonia sp. JC769]|uniref:DNA polymerase I n=1 Tax=Tautonia sp. JC769 TaxID=3232135 RepID=UPI003459FF89